MVEGQDLVELGRLNTGQVIRSYQPKLCITQNVGKEKKIKIASQLLRSRQFR